MSAVKSLSQTKIYQGMRVPTRENFPISLFFTRRCNKLRSPITIMLSLKEQTNINPMSDRASHPDPDSRRWLLWGYILLGAWLLWRLFYVATGLIELSPDESLFWLQSKHLALSYY